MLNGHKARALIAMAALVAAGLVVLAELFGSGALAERGRTVTACSRYGNGCYTAPVRPGKFGGLEMRMKGGTWIDCEGSCKDTLREKTVDFWETLRERSSRP